MKSNLVPIQSQNAQTWAAILSQAPLKNHLHVLSMRIAHILKGAEVDAIRRR